MPARAVCFDVMGTLFNLGRARERLQAVGAPPAALEAWFGRTLHTAAVLTMVGDYRPFPEVAEPALRCVLAQLELDPERAAEVVASLGELDAYPEAAAALERLAAAGVAAIALTNGTEANTRRLLERAGLDARLKTIVSTEQIRAFKPHAAVYERAADVLGVPAGELTLVAAHAWDVAGARAAGLDAIWISRVERVWPLPTAPDRAAADLTEAVELLLDG